jgi:hypothetical protein
MRYINILIASLLLSMIIYSADGAVKYSGQASCEFIRSSLLNNLDTVVRLEMANFQLKKDELYRGKYSSYFDEALSHYDTKALLRAVDSVSGNCPF